MVQTASVEFAMAGADRNEVYLETDALVLGRGVVANACPHRTVAR